MAAAAPLPAPPPAPGAADGVLLAVDSASSRVSVALGAGDEVWADLHSSQPRTGSEGLLQLIDDALRTADLRLESLSGLLALRGPGSFTGLRIGMATILGLHEATGVRATALSSLDVLAHGAARRPESAGRPITAVVDALRGEWFTQRFPAPGRPGDPHADRARRADGPPHCSTVDQLRAAHPEILVGADLSALETAAVDWPRRPRFVELPTLAALALSVAAAQPVDWESSALLEPHYLRGAAARPLAEHDA